MKFVIWPTKGNFYILGSDAIVRSLTPQPDKIRQRNKLKDSDPFTVAKCAGGVVNGGVLADDGSEDLNAWWLVAGCWQILLGNIVCVTVW